ncbi:hypothetical protein TRFO_29546 [Tritrichomonas foetus]|uniref:Myb-like DNA-binding domain containing protein n=1 Tax=Tritrichomonas foetus TaxID=1144522 RepID=A0A1J4JVD7_9EUKA|nr:hypothetical protein TRFO_29546 [Tritrichomonas foetus]|eukprot:OHT03089.1 hypothetical protein TRFO_29546 [Tritrichomonas foetus]
MNESKNKKRFTREEDQRLLELVALHGAKKWDMLANKLGGRCGRQCRDRYVNYLSPKVKKTKWTTNEDRLLIEMYRRIGPKWSTIARKFKGRTASALKNRWNFTVGIYFQDMAAKFEKKNSLSKSEESPSLTSKRSYTNLTSTTTQTEENPIENDYGNHVAYQPSKSSEHSPDTTPKAEVTKDTSSNHSITADVIEKETIADKTTIIEQSLRHILDNFNLNSLAEWDELCEIFES